MVINVSGLDFRLKNGNETILESSSDHPMIYIGQGEENVLMYRGNFKIDDYVIERRPLAITAVTETAEGTRLVFGDDLEAVACADGDLFTIRFEKKNEKINRFWIRVSADKGEHVYGCGEQMSYRQR